MFQLTPLVTSFVAQFQFLIDHLISELKSRFGSHQRIALQGFWIVPTVLVSLKESDNIISKLSALRQLYEDDLPSPDNLESEVHSWAIKWQKQLTDHGEASLPKTLHEALRHTSVMYPNITTLIKILCTLPVTSCSAERSFSGLKRVKTPFRAAMTNDRLTGLTLLHMHRDISIDIDKAIDTFANMHPRRMKMVDILGDDD